MSSRSASTIIRCSRVAGMPSGRCQCSYREEIIHVMLNHISGFNTNDNVMNIMNKNNGWIKWMCSHLSENYLKVLWLSGTLPPSPCLPCHQCDVITLWKYWRTIVFKHLLYGTKPYSIYIYTYHICNVCYHTHNNLNINIFYWRTSRFRHIGDGIFQLSTICTNLHWNKKNIQLKNSHIVSFYCKKHWYNVQL